MMDKRTLGRPVSDVGLRGGGSDCLQLGAAQAVGDADQRPRHLAAEVVHHEQQITRVVEPVRCSERLSSQSARW